MHNAMRQHVLVALFAVETLKRHGVHRRAATGAIAVLVTAAGVLECPPEQNAEPLIEQLCH